MSTRPGGLDQSWGEASAAAVKAAVKAAPGGNFVVSMYLSLDPSKNVTAADVKRYHPAGAGMLVNWEHQAGAPLKGAAQGRADATEAVRQLRALIKAVGYAPKTRLIIYFSCDRDVTAAQISGPVAAYYKAAAAVCHANGFGVGAYGEADLVKYLAAQKITDAEWQTYAWSRGALDPATDFYQYQNGQKFGGADVDFDRIIHAAELGAWWPPSHPLDSVARETAAVKPTPLPIVQEDDMPKILLVDQKDAKKAGVRWPGYFEFRADGQLTHIPTIARLQALRAIGCQQKTITVAQYRALGGK